MVGYFLTGIPALPFPGEVYHLLADVVHSMREGKIITLVPHTQRLTTQEAADFLGVSRPTLVKLLEDGRIPFEQPGRHRRVLFTDVLAYRERLREERRAALEEMTRAGSEAGLYTDTAEDYAAVLKTVRRELADSPPRHIGLYLARERFREWLSLSAGTGW